MDYHSDENERNKVQVLTAGGAASTATGTSRSKKKHKKKQAPKDPPVLTGGEQATGTTRTAVVTSSGTSSSTSKPAADDASAKQEAQNTSDHSQVPVMALEFEDQQEEDDWDSPPEDEILDLHKPYTDDPKIVASMDPRSSHSQVETESSSSHDIVWLSICFLGIMASFVCYGLLLEYTTSGGRKLHELSFLFVTSGLYTLTAAAGRYVRDETPSTIPPARFALLGLTSMGSTFCSVRSLRYVIYPIQVLAKSCKPVPVMLMGALLGKKYPLRKYLNVVMIVMGVALFMGGGSEKKKASPDVVDTTSANANDDADADDTSSSQIIGIVLLFLSLCFDGGTGAYEDKLMSVHSVQPFDLMYNIQLGKTILAFIGLLVLNELHIFIQMVQEMGFLLVALGLSGALGQVFIFVTIAKFGALTCSIIGLSRKVVTLVASIYFYGHHLNSVQFTGLLISVTAMVMNFWGKKKGGDGGHGDPPPTTVVPEEMEKMLDDDDEPREDDGDLEFAALPSPKELV